MEAARISPWTLRLAPAALGRRFRRWSASHTAWPSDALGAATAHVSCLLLLSSLSPNTILWRVACFSLAFSGSHLLGQLVCWPLYLRHRRRLQLAARVIRSMPLFYVSLRASTVYPELLQALAQRLAPGAGAAWSSAVKATLLLLLLHPLLSTMDAISFPVEYEQQLALTPLLLAADLLGAAPLAGCLLADLGLSPLLATPCRALQLSAAALFGVASDGAGTLALCSESAPLFVPAFCYAFLGRLLPLLGCYWAELGLKAGFLVARWARGRLLAPGAAAGPWPFRTQPRALLLGHVYAALGLSLCVSMVAAGGLVWAPGSHQRYCAVLASAAGGGRG